MIEKHYTLITRRSHSGLMINSGNAFSDLLDIATDQVPVEYTQEAWEERVRIFDSYARPGHIVTGIDYAIVCELPNPEVPPGEHAFHRDTMVAEPMRRRLFMFSDGSEVDVDNYVGLDADAISRRLTFEWPAAMFQFSDGGCLSVRFASTDDRTAELERMRAFRDGRAS